MDLFQEVLDTFGYPYVQGTTWTTDAFYRETPGKIARRKEMGAICVEMECSAMAAVAQFREKELFQFLYAADNLDGEKWDRRSLSDEVKFEEKDIKVIRVGLQNTEEISESGYKNYICLEKSNIDHEKYGKKCPFCELQREAYNESMNVMKDAEEQVKELEKEYNECVVYINETQPKIAQLEASV